MPSTNTMNKKADYIKFKLGIFLFLMQVLLCAVQPSRLGKYYSFWEFICFNWEKTYFLALGTIPVTGVGIIVRKITDNAYMTYVYVHLYIRLF